MVQTGLIRKILEKRDHVMVRFHAAGIDLTNECAADALQVRCVSEDLFMKQIGVLSADDMSGISAVLAIELDISS